MAEKLLKVNAVKESETQGLCIQSVIKLFPLYFYFFFSFFFVFNEPYRHLFGTT